MNRIRILVVDDHAVVRQGFATFLKTCADFDMVGEAQNGQEALALCQSLHPDVVLMDMMMPEMNGVQATRAIRQQFPKIQVIALTSFTDDHDLIRSAIQAGAQGYLFKNVSISELAHAIRNVYQGNPILAPEATRALIAMSSERPINLSERELEVLALMVKGLNNNEIAERLVISRSTVKFHVSSILSKLGATGRAEAVAYAVQHRLV